jgi:hypothetical protein
MLFIIQVAAVSCADTQVPETTLANQSLLKVGFCKAIQLEVLVIRIGASSAPKMHQDRLCRYRIRHRVNFSRTPEPSSISRKSRIAVDSQGVAIQGYDPVAYFTQNKPVKGSPSNQSVYQGANSTSLLPPRNQILTDTISALELVFQNGRVMSPDEAKYPEWRFVSLDEQGLTLFWISQRLSSIFLTSIRQSLSATASKPALRAD